MNDHDLKKHKIYNNLLNCKECQNYNIVTQSNHQDLHGCKTVQCKQCANTWYICEIHKLRFQRSRFGKCKDHFNTFHQSFLKNTNMMKNLFCSEINALDDDNSHVSIDINREDLVNGKDTTSGNSDSQTSPKDEILKTLISNSFAQDLNSTSEINKSECQFHLETTKFCLGLTESQQNQFASLLHQVTTTDFNSTRLPLDHNDIRKFYTSYKYSIYENIPCPKAYTFENHACISLESVIEKTLSLGLQLDLIKVSEYTKRLNDNSSLLNVKFFNDIMKMVFEQYNPMKIDPYIFMLIIWSDAFEPNNTRQNKHSIWLKTVTLCPSMRCDTSINHTFALCMGFKNDSHDNVNIMYNTEIKSLEKVHYFYIEKLRETVPCVFHIITMSNDRPERCAMNNLLQYGNSTKRFGYCSLTKSNKIASCPKCYSNNIFNIFEKETNAKRDNTGCRLCCDFEFGNKKEIERFDVPIDYPRTYHPSSPQIPPTHPIFKPRQVRKLFPYKQNYTSLKQGVHFAIYNLHQKSWKPKEGIAYLKMFGLSGNTISGILEFAANKNLAQDNVQIPFFEKYKFPCMWSSSLDLDQFIEVPMHHIFEGIVKATIEIQISFFKWYKKWSMFGNDSNITLHNISVSKTDFCKALPFSGDNMTTGGWIAEQYVAYARIMNILMKDYDKYVDENSLGYTEMIVLTQSCHSLVAHLMTNESIKISKIKELIKIFLGTCHYYEEAVGNDQHEPFWFRKSDFFSLMNLPDQIYKFGPLRLHWEGTREKFIQYIKPMLTNLRVNSSYLVTKLQQRSQNSFLELLMDKTTDKNQKKYTSNITSFGYQSVSVIQEKIKKNETLKGLLLKNQKVLFTLVCNTENLGLCQINFSDENGVYRCGQFYSEINCDQIQVTKSCQSKQEIYNQVMDFVMFVPLYPNQTMDIHLYTIITKEWKQRNKDGEYLLPVISHHAIKKMYENITTV